MTNGNDLVAAYCRQSKHFPRSIVELACEGTEVGDRPKEYEVGQSRYFFGLAFNIIKAWLMSFFAVKRD